MTIYNAIHDGDEYRITKFDRDGNVQSSYTCNHVDCTCPAGPRDTCRHRQMLPTFLEHNLVNSHLFLDWDNGRRIVDFQGQTAIQPATVQSHETIEPISTDDLFNLPQYHGVSIKTVDHLAPQALTDTSTTPIEPSDIRSPSDLYGEKEFMVDMFAKDITPTKPATPNRWRRF